MKQGVMKPGDIEFIQRLFAEAILQLGGSMSVSPDDLEAHRGRVEVYIENGIITCQFNGKGGQA
jgi:hypothetical protein